MSKEKTTAEEKVVRRDMYFVPVSSIEIEEGFNARQDYGDIESLAESIKQNGVKVPLRGYKKRGSEIYVLTDGHRRYKATQLAIKKGAEIKSLPFITEPFQSEDRRTLDLLICNDGKPLTMLEEADVYRRMIAYGWTEKQLAKETGKSTTAVNNCLLLLKASPALKEKIQTGVVSATIVLEKLRKKDAKDVEDDINAAVEKAGGKKITNKHIKQKKEKDLFEAKIDPKPLARLQELLNNSYGNLDEVKMGVLDDLIAFAKGNKDFEDLANCLV